MHLNLARTLPRSAANGPGERFVVWVQGCPLRCSGCWNPDTWSSARRVVREVDDLAAEILATPGIEGVTFTGGEPFAQALSLAALGRAAREGGLSVFIFTGYDLNELEGTAERALLDVTDVLVTGRYMESNRSDSLAWRGSGNQSVHFRTRRYGPASMEGAPRAEMHIAPGQAITVTGFPTDAMLKLSKSDRWQH